MIQSKSDYKFYLAADRLALGRKKNRPGFWGDEIWKFERILRKREYYLNCKKSIFFKPIYLFCCFRFHRLSLKLGFSIPVNVFGPGLSIAHRGTIVVNPEVRVGKNCRLHVGVNIGTGAGNTGVPIIGDNVYIGPGAAIFGDIEIADGMAIGANAVVNRSFREPGIGIAGVPAKKINHRGSEGLIIKATSLLNRKIHE